MSAKLSVDNISNFMNLYNCSEYIPIYDLLNNQYIFNIDNSNNIIINNCNNYNILECQENNEKKNIFCKFAPIVNYTKYLAGKLENEDISILPSEECKNGVCCEKMMQKHNAAYVDCLFYYLTSKSKKEDNFIHGLDFYGSFIGINKNYKINIGDDMDVLIESEYFHENIDKKYTLENIEDIFCENTSGKNKLSLQVSNENIEIENFNIENLNDIQILSNNELNRETSESTINELKDNEIIIDGEIKIHDSDDSDTSVSNDDDDALSQELTIESLDDNDSLIISGSGSDDDNSLPERLSDQENEADNEEEDDDEEDYDEESECNIIANIYNFPVQTILLEQCCETLEEYMIKTDEINIDEWKSIFFQIIIMLCYYQDKYSFTHNDLHTGNIMYNETDIEFLYYKYKNICYKVPTFGKIYKIIDFGRAIFIYNDTIFCSDAFSRGEDADTQYNCDPFFNDKKPRIEPNYSFDLCRLGCSLFDFFIDAMEEIDELVETNPIIALIVEWCQDDNFKSVLYRKNGDERYPEFKLYKMIARNVHRHIPEIQLKKELFKDYVTDNIDHEQMMNF